MGGEVVRYIGLWNAIYAPIGAVGYRSPIPAELTVTVAGWLEQNGYRILGVLFSLAMFQYGYGDLCETPIWYMLAYFTPSIVTAFIGANSDNLFHFHAVMTKYSKAIKGPIHTNAQVTRIARFEERACVAYRIRNNHRTGATQECSEMILVFLLTVDELASAGLDVSAEEMELFSAVRLINYFPHVGGADFAAGSHPRFNAQQSRRRTH